MSKRAYAEVTQSQSFESSQDMPSARSRRNPTMYRTKRSKKSKVPRPLRYGNEVVHSFKRISTLPASPSTTLLKLLQGYGAGATGGGWNGTGQYDLAFAFSLKNTFIYFNGSLTYTLTNPDYAGIENLFDFYRIDKVGVDWQFSSNISALNSTAQLPLLAVATDYNDTSGVTWTDILSHDDCKIFSPGNARNGTHHTTLRPKVQIALYNGAVSGYGEPAKAMWINTSSDTLIHYGLKLVADTVSNSSGSAENLGFLTPIFTYYISCKNSK